MRTIALVALLSIFLAGCQTPGLGGGDSPATHGGGSTALQGQGAQAVGGDQGQAETPQTNTTGTASNMFKFASEGIDPGIGQALIAVAKEQSWTADQLSMVFKSMNGAPETVTFTIDGGVSAHTGSAENVGSAGGTGGGGGAGNVPPNPNNN